MNPIVAAELVTLVSLGISLAGLFGNDRTSHVNRKLIICVIKAMGWIVLDIMAYAINGPKYPAALLYVINLLSYLAGTFVLISFLIYWKEYMDSFTKLDKFHYTVPIGALLCSLLINMISIFPAGRL